MRWQLQIDNMFHPIEDAAHLNRLLLSEPVEKANELLLERVQDFTPPRFERIIYRMLRLPVPEYVSHGSLSLSFASDRAFVEFLRNEDDTGVTAFDPEETADERLQFRTANNEPFFEPKRHTIPRTHALALLNDFYLTSQRPSSAKWSGAGDAEDQ